MYGTFNPKPSMDSLKNDTDNIGGMGPNVTSTVEEKITETEQPITFQDLGIPVVHTTRQTIFGTVQTCRSLNVYEISFLILSILSFLLSLGLTIQRLLTLDNTSEDFTFAIILLLTTGFCLYYAVDGIFLERLYELLVCVCSTLIVMIYCVLNYTYSDYDVLKLVRMILAIILGLSVMGTGSILAFDYIKSGDLIFRTVGGNIGLQRACHILFFVQSLLGFDLQLEACMLIFVMRNGTHLGELEKIVLGVGVPFSVLWIVFGSLASRLENKPLSYMFFSTFWVEPAYVIYKFVTLHEMESNILRYSIIACGSAAIIVRTMLIIAFVFAMRNFGKGLKEKIYGRFSS